MFVVELDSTGHLGLEQLSDWKTRVENWMLSNLDDNFTCDWEWGGEITDPAASHHLIADPDWYLYITFDNENDKIKFILRWG